MKFVLTCAQAGRLFKGGESELLAKLEQAKSETTNTPFQWGTKDDPEDGEAELRPFHQDEWAFMLEGSGPCCERLLESAGIVPVTKAVIEALAPGLLFRLVTMTTLMRPDGNLRVGSIKVDEYPACTLLLATEGGETRPFLERKL